MKKLTPFPIIFFFVLISVLLFANRLPATAQDGHSRLPSQVQDPMPADWPDEPGAMPGLIGGRKADRPLVFINPAVPVLANESVAAPTIDVWYGKSQNFGKKGNPQQWVNILGSVSASAGIKSLTYTLKGTEKPLSFGPDGRRLVNDGDFNVELDYEDLSGGENSVTIEATDKNDQVTRKKVTINYTRNKTWPENYDAEWTTSSKIQDEAQIVDGKWGVNGASKLFPEEVGYDRLIAIGDIGDATKNEWTDYEVTVPITVKGLDEAGFEGVSNGPAIGLALRWQGHTLKEDEQPRLDWERIGAMGRYHWQEKNGAEGLELRGYDWRRPTNTAKVWEFDTTYIMKMSVQSGATSTRAYYRLKFWKQGENEPVAWDVEGLSSQNNMPSGSVLLVAHHVDAEFGDVKIRRLADLDFTLDTNTTGSGTVTVKPDSSKYEYGQKVMLSAVPSLGYYLESWSGDLSAPGSVNPLEFDMTSDASVTANFAEVLPGILTVNIEGQGDVTKDPDKESYEGGEKVTLTAVPGPGSIFTKWSGDLSGAQNPATIMINGDQTVTATFEEVAEGSPISDEFNRCELYTDLWTFVNPSGGGAVNVADSELQLTVPAGPSMTMWDANRDAPRVMQDTKDEDFTVEIKFNSLPQSNHQIQGFLVEQDDDNWIRFDFLNKNGEMKMFAGVTTEGSSVSKWSELIDVTGASELYMRVKRVGDTWTQSYSLNGTAWQTPQSPVSFEQPLEIKTTGIFAANENSVGAAEFVARADYLRNVAFPAGITGYLLSYEIVGSGDVQLDPEPDANGRYVCNQQVALEALPAEKFIGWSGDLTGSENTATLTMDADKAVTATFVQTYELSTDAEGNGQVVADPDQESYDEGDEVMLTAVPDKGYAFFGWSGDAGGNSNPLTVIMDSDKSITATFYKPIIYMPVIVQP